MSSVSAIEAEYKNSLIKVELQKTGDNNCNINLYTQKNFSEPVRVIKKSDLNYYILLPETSNSSSTSINSSDIRNVTTRVYPYAGADIENGYTKIDINTTKPLNFSITTKNVPNQAKATQPKPASVQQKPIVQQKPQTQKPVVQPKPAEPKKEQPKAPTPTVKKEQPKAEIKTEKKIEKKTPEQQPKANKPAVSQPVKTKNTIEKPKKEPIKQIEPTEEVQQEQLEPSQEQAETPIDEQINPEQPEIIEPEPSFLEEKIGSENFKKIKRKLAPLRPLKNKIESKTLEYGLNFYDFLLMAGVASITFIFMLLLFSRKPKKQPKLKSKADLIEKEAIKPTAKKETNKNNGQYFVFENQAQKPAQKKNYELSAYDPKINAAYNYKDLENAEAQEESKIINKILKEDSYSEITPEEFINRQEALEEQTTTAPTEAPKVEVIEDPKVEAVVDETEPNVLSSIEIAPHRGFMCVRYEGNINLMGYIFDDVFALYNFKKPELNDYNIKFRLSEKTEKSANFIVKVDKTKLLIGVTKSSMNLEVEL